MVWQAIRRGMSVAMIDHACASSSSRVAAGLVTPITGARLALSWRYSEFFVEAQDLYRFAESKSLASFWSESPALRIFETQAEQELFETRWARPEYLQQGNAIHVEALSPTQLAARPWSIDGCGYNAPYGGFLMSPAARLQTEVYLNATRGMLAPLGLLFDRQVDLNVEMVPCQDGFHFPTIDLLAKRVCLAQGVAARSNRWFESLALHPARGDILKLKAHAAGIQHVVHHQAWVVPLESQEYLLGATYTRDGQDCQIDSSIGTAAREELITRWQRFFSPTAPAVEVIDHRAAVRPASYDRHPLIGAHLEFPNLVCLNGLGSKGSLFAPGLAGLLLDHLEHGRPVEPSLRFDRRRC